MDTLFFIMIFCSWILAISFFNGVHYFLLIRKLKPVYDEYKREIHEAVRCDKLTVSAFFREPTEIGDDKLDLLLFKIHRAAMWFVLHLIFYVSSIFFVLLVILTIRKLS